MIRKRFGVLAAVAVVAAAGIGTGVAIAVSGSGAPAPSVATSGAPGGPGYSYYRSMMGRYHGGMMSGGMMGGRSWQWMMGASGYRWMMGGAGAPGWMRGGKLPAAMMGGGTDPGQVIGRLWAGAPGPRVSPATAAGLGTQAPAGAQVNRAARTITFTTTSVRLTAVASPLAAPMKRSGSLAWSTRRSSSQPNRTSASRSSTPTTTPPTAWSSPPAARPRGRR
jgi:hypothetical protein